MGKTATPIASDSRNDPGAVGPPLAFSYGYKSLSVNGMLNEELNMMLNTRLNVKLLS